MSSSSSAHRGCHSEHPPLGGVTQKSSSTNLAFPSGSQSWSSFATSSAIDLNVPHDVGDLGSCPAGLASHHSSTNSPPLGGPSLTPSRSRPQGSSPPVAPRRPSPSTLGPNWSGLRLSRKTLVGVGPFIIAALLHVEISLATLALPPSRVLGRSGGGGGGQKQQWRTCNCMAPAYNGHLSLCLFHLSHEDDFLRTIEA